MVRDRLLACVFTLASATVLHAQSPVSWSAADHRALQSVADVQLSPTGAEVAYALISNDTSGRPTRRTVIRDLATGQTRTLVGASGARWSPDGQQLAYVGRTDEGAGLIVVDRLGTRPRLLAPVGSTNHPLPSSGERLSWSPDGRRLVFVSAVDGPEGAAAPDQDPMVITRYLYKPTASEGLTRFNDNRRTHLFLVDVATRAVRQLTDGPHYEHSVHWSPTGSRILFVSNREPDADRVFNYDIFTVDADTGAVERLTQTRSAEYAPSWSPDGTRIAFSGTTRDLTSSETTKEDTHVWIMRADGTGRVELGRAIDNRQGVPQWSADGRRVYFTLQERGRVHLMALDATAAAPPASAATIVRAEGSVTSVSIGRSQILMAMSTPQSPAELYAWTVPSTAAARTTPAASAGPQADADRPRALTAVNAALLQARSLAPVESLTFSNEGFQVEAFLTRPAPTVETAPASVPLVVMIHGGPHGQQGPAFNHKAQVYAAQGWATLMVNYRGSTGYGQAFADAIFRDQNGAEGRDVLAGVDAALARHPWLDASRLAVEGGSYGGQLTNWLITQTERFRAAVPSAGISNLVTQNYLAYYHDYLAVEYGDFPHKDGIIDMLWERSPIRLAHRVKTPVLFLHGEHDNDVPIEEAEQFYVALHDVGTRAVMVRYPREGHGLQETRHIIDALDRSVAWYREHFRVSSPLLH
jgi:dipeptidyl aminopeptidase/acylaminoacyl peptidase